MRFKSVGNKQDIAAIVIRNAEASASIPVGSPVVFKLAATNPGLDVVLPSSEVTMATAGCYGVALATLAAGNYGEAAVFGYCQNIAIMTQTRAASSDSFSTNSGAAGLILCVDTVNNVFTTTGGTQAKSGFMPFAILAQSFTASGSATTSSDTRTVATVASKAFLRMM